MYRNDSVFVRSLQKAALFYGRIRLLLAESVTYYNLNTITTFASRLIVVFTFQIIDLSEIQYVAQLPLIRHLNLQRNPVRELPDYRLSVIFQIQKLCELDRRKVDVEEKVYLNSLIKQYFDSSDKYP